MRQDSLKTFARMVKQDEMEKALHEAEVVFPASGGPQRIKICPYLPWYYPSVLADWRRKSIDR